MIWGGSRELELIPNSDLTKDGGHEAFLVQEKSTNKHIYFEGHHFVANYLRMGL